MTDDLLAHNGHLAQVLGLHVGHFTHPDRPTGCSVVLCPQGATAGVDVRGAAPAPRETDLLHPSHLVQHAHGIPLAGGSAWGLDAASGTARWLEEQGAGLDIGVGRLPLVPAAVLFDLTVGDKGAPAPLPPPGTPPAKRPASPPAMSARPKAAWARGPGRWWAKFLVLTAPCKAALARPASPCMGSP